MSRNLYLPFWINMALLTCVIPTIRMLPETHDISMNSAASAESDEYATEESGPLLEGRTSSPERYSTAFEPQTGVVISVIGAIRKLIRLTAGRRNFQTLLCSFFLTAQASSDTKLLVQYISKRYEWTFAEAGYMLSVKATVNFTLLAIIVPRIIRTSMESKPVSDSEVRLNHYGAQISILISVVGVLCVALAFEFWMLLTGNVEVSLKSLELNAC
jgi:hypothetical protein